MSVFHKRLSDRLGLLRQEGNHRQLGLYGGLADFSSNDYLGILHDGLLDKRIAELPHLPHGSGGSRLIGGNSEIHEKTEAFLAEFFGHESALLFNSGYDANLAVLSTLPEKGDTVLYDEHAHASIRDGLRLTQATSWAYRHNDLGHLKEKLSRATGQVFIVTETVFSMDGTMPELEPMVQLCQETGALLILDEAHAGGVFGPQGRGRAYGTVPEETVAAGMVTFGKAYGAHGAAVLCSSTTKDWLTNRARPFVYTTAMPPFQAQLVQEAVQLAATLEGRRQYLQQLCMDWDSSPTPIKKHIVGNAVAARALEARLKTQGYFAKAICHPTVPKGSERLRIVLHAPNGAEETAKLRQMLM